MKQFSIGQQALAAARVARFGLTGPTTTPTTTAGTVTSVDLEGQQGNAVWKVSIVTDKGVEHEVTVDAGSGKAMAVHTDRSDDDRTDD
ncbi:PepSY domain-containing protein [Streptomyces sp. NPDC001351]|uniref:PepSY domain-containing protein n=1 Tax=Streptomyces sp. NPDC001351 TaxID=3364564 RepID=UPI0036D17FAE